MAWSERRARFNDRWREPPRAERRTRPLRRVTEARVPASGAGNDRADRLAATAHVRHRGEKSPSRTVRADRRYGFRFVRFSTKNKPLFPGTDQIEIAVAIHIDDRNLHPSAHPPAVVDDVPDPLGPGRAFSELVPVHAERLLLARVAAVVRHEPFAGHQVQTSVGIQIDERGRVPL